METDLTAYVPMTERDIVPIVLISRSQTSVALSENLSLSVVVDARTYLHKDGAEVSFKPLGAVVFRFNKAYGAVSALQVSDHQHAPPFQKEGSSMHRFKNDYLDIVSDLEYLIKPDETPEWATWLTVLSDDPEKEFILAYTHLKVFHGEVEGKDAVLFRDWALGSSQ